MVFLGLYVLIVVCIYIFIWLVVFIFEKMFLYNGYGVNYKNFCFKWCVGVYMFGYLCGSLRLFQDFYGKKMYLIFLKIFK